MAANGSRIGGLLSDARVPYQGADFGMANRMGGALLIISALLEAAVLPGEPPTAQTAAGWGIAVPAVALMAGLGVFLLTRGKREMPNLLLAVNYFGLCQVALLTWLAGGAGTAYAHVIFFLVMFVAAVHPLGRWLAFAALANAVQLAPLAYDVYSSSLAYDYLIRGLEWTVTGFVAVLIFAQIRKQRLTLARQGVEARRQARNDALTGLGNRRAFEEALAEEVARAERLGQPLSLIMADLDHFKNVNDKLGHQEGDQMLRRAGRALTEARRQGDRCFRYGGEEFAILLPQTSLDQARAAAERLRAAVDEVGLVDEDLPRVTMSCGVAELRPGEGGRPLVSDADAALLDAKRHGRDRTELAVGPLS